MPDKADKQTDNTDSGGQDNGQPLHREIAPDNTQTTESPLADHKESPLEVAERLMRETGKVPSIRRLAKEAGITRHQADKILAPMRKRAG
ncbi:hypothetical protein ACFO25_00220 [Paenactinomyces guangxiensis]|uniref:hypothetical protein n=1 Tax=Paenactinomyces guangxiensis TaxID=1490290 RepID=UPI001E591BDE|nr:hypothetical protein [Paenactinomyces guangxiensis]